MLVERRQRSCICFALFLIVFGVLVIMQNFATLSIVDIVVLLSFLFVPSLLCIIYEMRKGRGLISTIEEIRTPPSTPTHIIEPAERPVSENKSL